MLLSRSTWCFECKDGQMGWRRLHQPSIYRLECKSCGAYKDTFLEGAMAGVVYYTYSDGRTYDLGLGMWI